MTLQRHRFAILAILTIVLACISASAQDTDTSAAQRAWETKVGKKLADSPAFAYVEDDPALPRVLLIGDSISIGYTANVRERLAGKANVHRIPANGGDTRRGLASLDAWLDDGKWDVIHFNWGLHDLKRQKDGKMDVTAERAVAPETYEKNLRELVARLRKTGATLIWCATTPVPEGSAGRIPGDDMTYNAIAAKVMNEMNVTVNDLYAHVKPELSKHQREANVHFHNDGSAFLGKQVAAVIQEALAK